MLIQINKEYLVSIKFVSIVEAGIEYLKKDYVAIQLYNKEGEIVDLVDVSIYLKQSNSNWIIDKCISLDSKQVDVFKVHFKNNHMRELLKFDLINDY